MPTQPSLSSSELTQALAHHPGWEARGKAIARAFKCSGFLQAIELVDQVAAEAQRMDHHPDMLIQFDQVTFTLSSHDAGGVTHRDLKLAAAIDALAGKLQAKPAAPKQ